ncbi:hypothetical protein GWI33_002961, partial [Rhynchophorus ferrugineus]
MVMIGLRLLLKKPQPEQPIEQHELPVEAQSQQPIVPRHLRQLQGAEQNNALTETVQQVSEPLPNSSSPSETVVKSDIIETVKQQQASAQTMESAQILEDGITQDELPKVAAATTPALQKDELDHLLEQLEDEDQSAVQHGEDKTLAAKNTEALATESEQVETEVNAKQYLTSQHEPAKQSEQNVEDIALETVEIQEWQGESDVLDAHLSAQNRN